MKPGPSSLLILISTTRATPRACWMCGVLVLAVAWLGATDRSAIGQVAVLGIVGQMFAAATGFSVDARRGYYDALLVRGRCRLACAVTHCLVSAGPGTAAAALASAVGLTLPMAPRPDLETAALAVLGWVYVSLAVWALNLFLSRYAAGVAWLLCLVGLGGTDAMRALRLLFLTPPVGKLEVLRQGATMLLCPMFLFGSPNVPAAGAVAVVAATSLALLAGGLVAICRHDVPLDGAV